MLGFSDIMGSRSEQDGCCSKGPPDSGRSSLQLQFKHIPKIQVLHLDEGADGRNV